MAHFGGLHMVTKQRAQIIAVLMIIFLLLNLSPIGIYQSLQAELKIFRSNINSNIDDLEVFIRKTVDRLAYGIYLLKKRNNIARTPFFPVYNYKTHIIEGLTATSIPFYIYAFAITGNFTYLGEAMLSAIALEEYINEKGILQPFDENGSIKYTPTSGNLFYPQFFAWLSLFDPHFLDIAKKMTDAVIKYFISEYGLPYKAIYPDGKPSKDTVYLPFNVMSCIALLSKMYEFTLNETYLSTAIKIVLSIFQYLKNPKTGLLHDSYKITNNGIEVKDNFQRVYSAGLIIGNMLYLYLLSGNEKILRLLKDYVQSVKKYFWVVDKEGVSHWAYRVYVSGNIAWDTIETNFFKLDYYLLLYYIYVERDPVLLERIITDINSTIAYNSRNYIFTHSPKDFTALIYGQLSSFVYLVTLLKRLGYADFTQWLIKHFYSVVNAFMKEYGFVKSIYVISNETSSYGPLITYHSTAYLYSMLYFTQDYPAWSHVSLYPFPLTYIPNVDIPYKPYYFLKHIREISPF